LDTDNWRVYKHREEPNGVCLVLSIDSKSITALERMSWRPFSSAGRTTFFSASNQRGGSKEEIAWEEEEEEAELGMVSTISFTQANLQHSIAASRVISRTVSVKGIDMALIQEPWYCKGCIRGLNIPGYTLFSASRTDRPRTCILMRNETAWMLPEFSYRDLVAVLIRYEEEAECRSVVCSAYLPYDSEDPPP
jgi:hypothetical protein